ncbi:unnamed protein product [Adineta ricciae]|uniref:Uncharacterized protein n=1 Tax=Adineta ricciae TaxID=249248 RepID=A0A815YNY0_ADIRI|nr:unnamed protein product [Adineta ricciae]CAF1573574.1 unnamed protein product [Adineta ricciae]
MWSESLNADYQNQINKKYIAGAMNSFCSSINRLIVDENKVGDTFILVFKDEIGIRKLAHHAILIDVAGASDEIYLKGILLHLTSDQATRKSKFRYGDKRRARTDFYEVDYIG